MSSRDFQSGGNDESPGFKEKTFSAFEGKLIFKSLSVPLHWLQMVLFLP
jgi:hypothetical protein